MRLWIPLFLQRCGLQDSFRLRVFLCLIELFPPFKFLSCGGRERAQARQKQEQARHGGTPLQ